MVNIARTSPLYEYWQSSQDDNEENKRLLMIESSEPASILFKDEPYKWENLYQNIVRKIISGDSSSIKGLIILLATLNKREKEKTLKELGLILDNKVIDKLRNGNYRDAESSKNIFTFLFILLGIFTNPYGLEIKRRKKHIYEKTGMIIYRLRNFFSGIN